MAIAQDPTKARLLEAAGFEFAAKGFEGATVRAICDRAGVNVAAINYHFGDKVQLYEQAVLHAHRCGPEFPIPEVGTMDPAAQLRQYVGFFLGSIVLPGRPTWHHALTLREMIEPTSASDVLVREAIRPRFERLSAIIRAIAPGLDDRRVHATAFGVVGQCLHYKVTRTISVRLIGPEAFEQLDLGYLVDHITRGTLATLGAGPGPVEPRRPAGGREER